MRRTDRRTTNALPHHAPSGCRGQRQQPAYTRQYALISRQTRTSPDVSVVWQSHNFVRYIGEVDASKLMGVHVIIIGAATLPRDLRKQGNWWGVLRTMFPPCGPRGNRCCYFGQSAQENCRRRWSCTVGALGLFSSTAGHGVDMLPATGQLWGTVSDPSFPARTRYYVWYQRYCSIVRARCCHAIGIAACKSHIAERQGAIFLDRHHTEWLVAARLPPRCSTRQKFTIETLKTFLRLQRVYCLQTTGI